MESVAEGQFDAVQDLRLATALHYIVVRAELPAHP